MQESNIQPKRGRGRPSGSTKNNVEIQDYNPNLKIKTYQMKDLNFDKRIFEPIKTNNTILDPFLSSVGGFLPATNIICIGDPGIGKTTVMLDIISSIFETNPTRKVLFLSGEMGKIDMVGYCKRYPKFANLDILFMEDYLDDNPKQVLEQTLEEGYDLVLIDSWAEVSDAVREFYNWDRRKTESWMLSILGKHNNGENRRNVYTCFLPIQQVTKGGDFVGSNKLKHMTSGMIEMRIDKETNFRYMFFSKNRRGTVGEKLGFILQNENVAYTKLYHPIQED